MCVRTRMQWTDKLHSPLGLELMTLSTIPISREEEVPFELVSLISTINQYLENYYGPLYITTNTNFIN